MGKALAEQAWQPEFHPPGPYKDATRENDSTELSLTSALWMEEKEGREGAREGGRGRRKGGKREKTEKKGRKKEKSYRKLENILKLGDFHVVDP